jgi:hypothetical protein
VWRSDNDLGQHPFRKVLMKKKFAVRIEAYEGDKSSIAITSDNSIGEMYCVGIPDNNGVIDLIDNGYPSLGELYTAWPELKPRNVDVLLGTAIANATRIERELAEGKDAGDVYEEESNDGTSGQDRESYSDTQDRDSYTVDERDKNV